MATGDVVDTLDALVARWPDLRDAVIVGLDPRAAGLAWEDADLRGAVVLGCELPPGVDALAAAGGAGVVAGFDRPPFPVYRSALYTYGELTAPVEADGVGSSLDEMIGSWFRAARTAATHDTTVRTLHDATIEAAVARFVVAAESRRDGRPRRCPRRTAVPTRRRAVPVADEGRVLPGHRRWARRHGSGEPRRVVRVLR